MTCIIVMGCFRSGTSAVAGALHHMGVFMGDQFDQPNNNNPKGFWEDLEFKRLHVEYDDETSDKSRIDALYKELICKRNSLKIWGVKDPLLCKFLDKLTVQLEDLGNLTYVKNKLILCRRSVEEISISMAKSIGISDPTMFKSLAQHYVDSMEKSLLGYKGPVLEIQKTDSMSSCLEPIADFVNLQVTDAAREFLKK
jgi:hypothetical protein